MAQLGKRIDDTQVCLPIRHSFQFDELEMAMVQVFRQIMKDFLMGQINELHYYGMPYLGDIQVIERFTKLNGLAVLRRNDGLSDKIMAIILANWQSLASERGLGFLKFVLDMLYPNQHEIVRLWHSRSRAWDYPNHLYESQTDDGFLTSRIRIKIHADINIKELSEIAPVFRRLVPWHIVPEVTIGFHWQKASQLGVAMVGEFSYLADFSPDSQVSRLKHNGKIRHDNKQRYNGRFIN